jgi:hypothetical protein
VLLNIFDQKRFLTNLAMQQQPQSALPGTSNFQGHTMDTTGQIAPPGVKPRVTATLWEDEGSLCFQVEAKGICVARREGMLISIPQYHTQLT